jgi:hypothetical protein
VRHITAAFEPWLNRFLSQDTALFFIAFVAPLLLQWLTNFLTIRNVWDAHNSALGCMSQNLLNVPMYADQHI